MSRFGLIGEFGGWFGRWRWEVFWLFDTEGRWPFMIGREDDGPDMTTWSIGWRWVSIGFQIVDCGPMRRADRREGPRKEVTHG